MCQILITHGKADVNKADKVYTNQVLKVIIKILKITLEFSYESKLFTGRTTYNAISHAVTMTSSDQMFDNFDV